MGAGLGGRGWFELLLGRSPFTLLLQHSLLVSEVPLVLCLFRLLGIFVGHSRTTLTTVLDDGLYLGFPPPITDLDPGSEETQGVCTHGGGGPPLIFLLSIKPLT